MGKVFNAMFNKPKYVIVIIFDDFLFSPFATLNSNANFQVLESER